MSDAVARARGESAGHGDQESWDLVVVGAGPAGSAAVLGALAAAPHLRVLLLDRADFPRDKSCGDGIAPHVLDALAEVGVHDLAAGWEPVVTLGLTRGDSRVTRPLARPAWVIPRRHFDARLVDHAVAAGATLRRHRVRDLAGGPGGVVIDGQLRARVLVGADGAGSRVRARLDEAPGPLPGQSRGQSRGQSPGQSWQGWSGRRRALAIRGYAPTPSSRRGHQAIVYGDRRQPSYAWAFDRGDGLSNVGYGELVRDRDRQPPTRAILLEQLERLLPGAASSGSDWKGHHLPLTGWRWPHPDGPVLLAGDAADLVNPLTGEGIYYAVATGLRAGRAAAAALAADDPGSAGAAYRSQVRRLLGRHLRHTATAARLSRLPVVVDAGIHAAARDARVFDDLVEIGLGRGLLTRRLLLGLARDLTRPARPGALPPTDPFQ